MISEGKSTATVIQEFLLGIQEAIDKNIHLNGNIKYLGGG